MNLLAGKTAVVTGARQGIGLAVAATLAEMGANVALVSATDPAAEAAQIADSSGVKTVAYPCDVSDFGAAKATCEKIVEDFGGVDILVNNAGITKDGLLLSMKEEDFDRVLAVNLKGTFNFTKHLARPLMKSAAGRIINISSVVGMAGNAGQANYAASKAGVIGFTKTMAKELASRGVTVNAIAPGYITTGMTDVLPDALKEKVLAAIPLKRMGTPDDIANLVLFLATEMAGYITGEIIKIDGGMFI